MAAFEDLMNPTKLGHCFDVDSLSRLLKVRRSWLLKYLYSGSELYSTFEVPKKNGSKRKIKSPHPPLKKIQKKIKKELEKYYVPRASTHGFVKDRSIISNAVPHLRKEYVFNIDLEDFFETISFGRVKRMFESAPFKMPHPVAAVVAHICCHNGFLPQGSPASPVISNIIAFKLDNQLLGLAKKLRFTYTRYADDLTFSFKQQLNSLPEEIIIFKNSEPVIGKVLSKIVSDNGFKVNFEKTRLQSKRSRQAVTNITVNKKLNLNRRFIRQTSSMLHSASKFGFEKAESEHFGRYHRGYIRPRQIKKTKTEPGTLFRQKLRGRLNFIRSVRGENCPVWRSLMYRYTEAIGEPNDNYKLTLVEIVARSSFVLHNKVGRSNGSGFLLEGVGLVTNEHVLEGYGDKTIDDPCLVEWLPKLSHSFIGLSLAFISKPADLAVIQSDFAFNTIKPLKAAQSPNYNKGAKVILIGYPQFQAGNTHTVISTEITSSYFINDLKRIRVKETISKGMSGGVAINEDGEVIGVISDGLDSEYGNYTDLPCGFIPISRVFELLKETKTKTTDGSADGSIAN